MKSWLRGLLGKKGEARAAAFLKQKGLRIVGRGVANRCGEIDLIALDGETIVFVEVRTRQSLEAGHPAESVTVEKQEPLESPSPIRRGRDRLARRGSEAAD
jgi:putative endonuclease